MAPDYTIGWVYNLQTIPTYSDASRLIAIACAFPAIALVAIVIRFGQRWAIMREFGLDDYSAAISLILGIAYSALAVYQTRWGLGLDAEEFPPENAIQFSKVQYIGGPIYCVAILGFKISLLASYHRVAGFNRTYRIVIYVVMGLVTINQLIYTFLLSFPCRPIHKVWEPTVPGVCIDQLASYFGLGGSSLGFDFIIIALPFPILRRLELDTKKKVALALLYALGFFVSVVQILRIQTIANLASYTDSKAIIIWSIVEINLGVVIACVPSFAPLLKRFGDKMSRGYRSHTRSSAERKSAKKVSLRDLGASAAAPEVVNHVPAEDAELEIGDQDPLWASKQDAYNDERHRWSAATSSTMTSPTPPKNPVEIDENDMRRPGHQSHELPSND